MEQRRQGQNESFEIYFASMISYFDRLVTPLHESQKIDLLLTNMHPYYADRLALVDIFSLEYLNKYCARLEEVRDRIDRQNLSLRPELWEPSLAARGGRLLRTSVIDPVNEIIPNNIEALDESEGRKFNYGTATRKALRCFNCDTVGHTFNNCGAVRKLFCFKCGLKNTLLRNFSNCSGNGGANPGKRAVV